MALSSSQRVLMYNRAVVLFHTWQWDRSTAFSGGGSGERSATTARDVGHVRFPEGLGSTLRNASASNPLPILGEPIL